MARLGRFDEAKAAIDDSYPESESVRYLAYADLLPVVDAGKREPLLTAIRSHYESVRAEDRATLIVALASYAQPEESTRLILDALRLLVSDAVWSRRKRGVLEDIVPLLERLPPETLKAQLRELLRTFARQDRDQFEIALWMLIPSLRRIGGDACLKRISETIADLGSWLP